MSKLVVYITCFLLLLVFAPIQLGGRTTYAIVSGNSMEPEFSRGDLILAVSQSRYSINDIILYTHPDIGPVFHRIIGIQDNRFILKGDNNNWVDSYQAAIADIRGKFLLKIPGLGRPLSWFHSAEGLPIATATLGVLMIGTIMDSRNKPQNQKQKRGKGNRPRKNRPLSTTLSVQDELILSTALFLLFLLLGIYAFTNPTFVTTEATYAYQHYGEFTYSTPRGSDVYDDGQLQPGDPIFRQIADRFDVGFAYTLQADGLSNYAASYSLIAIVGEPDGWKRTLEIIPPTTFEEAAVSFSAPVYINEIQDVVDRMEQETGLTLNQYQLHIQPHIQVQGLVHGIPWEDAFSPSIAFTVDDTQLRLEDSGSLEDSPLSQTESDSVSGPTIEINQLTLFGVGLNIHLVRIFLILLTPILLISVVVSGWRWVKLKTADPDAQIAGAYGPKIVDVTGRIGKQDSALIHVSRITALVRLADREGASILHEAQNGSHHYFVDSQTGSYTYVLETNKDELA